MSTSDTAPNVAAKWVGIELMKGEEADAVIGAATDDNDEVRVTEYPGYVVIEALGSLKIQRSSVEDHLGRAWNPCDLNLIMCSYFGNIHNAGEDEMSLSWSSEGQR